MNRYLFQYRYYNLILNNSTRCAIRFSSSSGSSSDDESSRSIKSSKSTVVKLKDKGSVQKKLPSHPKQDASKGIESLVDKAKQFKSVAPSDKQSVNKNTAKPRFHVRQSARPPVKAVEDREPVNVLAKGLDKRLVEAARRVADRMPRHLARETEEQLIDSIQKQKEETLAAKKKFKREPIKEDLTKSISYQIMREARQRTPPSGEDDRIGSIVTKIKLSERVARGGSGPQGGRPRRAANLFSGECLNLFDPKGIYLTDEVNQNLFWEKLASKEVELALDYPPENPFEEMIKWTKENKLWHYPIDNEQGLDDDAFFYEHVLLENLLVDFPDHGPVRQFMELVVMGLAQNPYITVERKHETIKFYKQFFDDKDLLLSYTEQEASGETS